MRKKLLSVSAVTYGCLLLFILLSNRVAAQQQPLLDSLTLDTLKAFTSIEEALKQPDKVVKLVLKKKKIKIFPSEIIQFTNIQYLDLSKNSIKELPPDIAKLASLQYLSLARNSIEELPVEIGELKNLYYLNVNNNELLGITSGIGGLTKLRNLDLWSNNLAHFPEELQNLKELKVLDLRAILIPDSEQARIQSLLPGTKIFFSPYCKCGQ